MINRAYTHTQPQPGHLKPLIAILLTAALLRTALLATGAFTFNADEAVVATMARHILGGRAFPAFFYGQAYMGSLDAILIALGFAVFGESVLTVRVVQSILYMGVIASTYWLGWRLTQRRWVAATAGLLVGVPPTVMTLYTTATLGGYNETLILGNLILIFAYEVTHGHEESWWSWALLGALAGLGWWTNGLIIAYLAPSALLILRHFAFNRAPRYLWAFVFLMLFSSPWWLYNFSHDNAAIEVFTSGRRADNTGFDVLPFDQRVLGMFLVGLPGMMGIRFPWSGAYFAFPLSALIWLGFFGVFFLYWLMRRQPRMLPGARGLLLGMTIIFGGVFVASTFGTDPTGRYFIPLIPVLAVLIAATLHNLRSSNKRLAGGIAIGLLAFYLAGNATAALRQPPGFTTQFDLFSHIPHEHDGELIDFLQKEHYTRGYSNYWVAFRFTFITGEDIILSSSLPYKENLSYNIADERYPPYREAVEQANAAQIVYITSNHPRLDEVIRQSMEAAGVTFDEKDIGPYHVFYNLSEHVTPNALGLHSLNTDRTDVNVRSAKIQTY